MTLPDLTPPQRLNSGYLVASPLTRDRLIEDEHIEHLAQSLANGQQQPLIVRPHYKPMQLEVIVGERRRQAIQRAKHELSEMILVENLSDEDARQLHVHDNLGDRPAVERAETTLRLINTRLLQQPQWAPLASHYPTALHAILRLFTLSLRRDPTRFENAAQQIGIAPNELEQTFHDALAAAYPGLSLRSFANSDARLITYRAPLRAAMRTNQISKSAAHAISQVKDHALQDELLAMTLEQELSVAQVRFHAALANTHQCLDAPDDLLQLREQLRSLDRALRTAPPLPKRRAARAQKLLTEVHKIIQDNAR